MKNTTNASWLKPNGLRLYTSQVFKLCDEIRIFMSRLGKLMTGLVSVIIFLAQQIRHQHAALMTNKTDK